MRWIKEVWRKFRQQDQLDELEGQIASLKKAHKKHLKSIYECYTAEVSIGTHEFSLLDPLLKQLCEVD